MNNYSNSPYGTCSQCEIRMTDKRCIHCHFHVCEKKKCSMAFPHHNMTFINICSSCNEEISEKLKLVINYNDLTLLKEKIKLKRQIQEG